MDTHAANSCLMGQVDQAWVDFVSYKNFLHSDQSESLLFGAEIAFQPKSSLRMI